MELFYIISGLSIFYKIQNDKPILFNLKKRIKQLIIPYLIWCLLYGILNITMVEKFTINWALEYIYEIITDNGIAPLWFLPTLFFSEMLFCKLYKICKGRYYNLTIIAIILSVVTLLSQKLVLLNLEEHLLMPLITVLRIFTATLLLFVGIFVGNIILAIKSKRKMLIYGFICLLITLLMEIVSENVVNMHMMELGNCYLFFVMAILGSTGILLISIYIENSKILEILGENTLGIMAIHHPPIPLIVWLNLLFHNIENYLGIDIETWKDLHAIVVFLFVMPISFGITILFNKYLAFSTGKIK